MIFPNVYYSIEMPINKDGQGPEMDNRMVVATLWLVWDDSCYEIAQCNTREDADKVAEALNFMFWKEKNENS